ncbi:MAG TPA: hypothetical protein VMV10_23065 [Pirellulales bacterium]|nr:hypothetical protein [Pirellulales bacterium]
MSHVSKPLKIAIGFSIAAVLLAVLASVISASKSSFLKGYLPILGAILFFAGLIAAIALLVTIGLYILAPLDRAARHLRRPTQFTMVDFLSLMFLFQLPMAALRGWASLREEPAIWIFYAFGWLATAAMWASSVRTLSRAGIENTWHRGVFLAFVLPAAYFGSIVFTASLFVAVVALFVEGAPSKAGAAALFALDSGLLLAFFLSAKFVRKMVAASGAEAEIDSKYDETGSRESSESLAEPMPGAEANVDHS